uniref:Predicted protein n=1 Tax=Hordeum vulgare subsp. vulgare TaxID=112509 RepID=F2CYD4_HORVV|nr:predicted protein [Hordeum vulgare subsp. vulgare]
MFQPPPSLPIIPHPVQTQSTCSSRHRPHFGSRRQAMAAARSVPGQDLHEQFAVGGPGRPAMDAGDGGLLSTDL